MEVRIGLSKGPAHPSFMWFTQLYSMIQWRILRCACTIFQWRHFNVSLETEFIYMWSFCSPLLSYLTIMDAWKLNQLFLFCLIFTIVIPFPGVCYLVKFFYLWVSGASMTLEFHPFWNRIDNDLNYILILLHLFGVFRLMSQIVYRFFFFFKEITIKKMHHWSLTWKRGTKSFTLN